MTSPAVLSITVTPRTEADLERLAAGLERLRAEDPTLQVQVGPQSGQSTIAGVGELHLEIVVERLYREFGVEAMVGKPQVAYIEQHDAANNAVLLEPVMSVEVTVPKACAGDIVESLSSRRGQIQSQEERDGAQVVQARVPIAEMFGYASDLRSRTQGRATYTMRFDRYEQVGGPDSGNDVRSSVGVPPPTAPPNISSRALPEPHDS